MEIIYGTGNQAKIAYMKRALEGLPLHITGLAQAAAAKRGQSASGGGNRYDAA